MPKKVAAVNRRQIWNLEKTASKSRNSELMLTTRNCMDSVVRNEAINQNLVTGGMLSKKLCKSCAIVLGRARGSRFFGGNTAVVRATRAVAETLMRVRWWWLLIAVPVGAYP